MQKKTIAAVAVAVAAAIALTVSLAVTLRPGGRGAASPDAGAAVGAAAPAPTAPADRKAPDFYYGVNLGMLNLYPFDKTPYRHTKPELQAMLAVGGPAADCAGNSRGSGPSAAPALLVLLARRRRAGASRG
jgi:hypothetical protein